MLEDGNGKSGAADTGVTRREFIATGLAAGAAVALSGVMPAPAEGAAAQAAAGTAVGETLTKIAEIGKAGVIKILNENKTYLGASRTAPGTTTPQTGQMRYFTGAVAGGKDIWPPKNGSPAPGPTVRA